MIARPHAARTRARSNRGLSTLRTARTLVALACAVAACVARAAAADDAPDPAAERASDSPVAPVESGAVEPPAGAALVREPRVILHARDVGDTLPASLELILQGLKPAPERVETRFVEIAVERDQVRYFHPGDAALARAVAERLRPVFGEVAVRDFGHYRPRPSAGLVELWVR